MTLSYDKNTPEIQGYKREAPIGKTTTIYAGSLVLIDSSGFAIPGKTATNHTCVGVAEKGANGSAGDTHVVVKSGIFGLQAYPNENLTRAAIGRTVYVTDEETVSINPRGRTPAGQIFDVSGDLIWVKI